MRFRTLSLLSAAALSVSPIVAQSYKAQVIVRGLDKPMGIAVHGSGDLYFTELPLPGTFSQRNTVSVWTASSGAIRRVVRGEPAPTNIDVFPNREFVWTCATVGPIMRGNLQGFRRIASGNKPSGIAISGTRIFVTQVPQPGRMGGNNSVGEIVNGQINVLKMGEPEPVDIAADAAGNLYWTCKSAGVILKRDANSNMISMLLNGLDKPQGIAVDAAGMVYFTEVPTPGTNGPNGGRNKVWKYDPMTRNMTLINFGDPEPADIAVSDDGSRVYWTCRTAGVIVRADRMATNTPRVLSMSRTNIGDKVDLNLVAPTEAGKMYLAATSGGVGPIPVDTRNLALSGDGLFLATIQNMGTPFFSGYNGTLNGSGSAMASIRIPNDAALRDLRLFTGFVTLDGMAPSGVGAISSTFRFQIQ